MRSNLLIYGVSGETGGMISRLAAAAGLPHLAAGRDFERVSAHADPLLLPTRIFSLSDPAKIDRGVAGVSVVLNAAGPFADTGPPLVAACLRSGAHYLDLAGDVQDFETIRRLDLRAREAGVLLMPGVGFKVVPSDALAARLRRRLPSAVRLRLVCEVAGGGSWRTLLSLLRSLPLAGMQRRDGELVPARAGDSALRLDLGADPRIGTGPRLALSDPWRGDPVAAYWSSVYPDIEVYAVHPPAIRWLIRGLRWPSLRRFLATAASSSVLNYRRVPRRRRSAAATDSAVETAPTAAFTRIWAQAEDPTGVRASALLRGPEVRLFTARTALWIAQRVLSGRLRVGFQTPVTAYGPDLIDRLVEQIEGLEVTWL
jgi:short subunit dehydrogenase-like uncharacterized protein